MNVSFACCSHPCPLTRMNTRFKHLREAHQQMQDTYDGALKGHSEQGVKRERNILCLRTQFKMKRSCAAVLNLHSSNLRSRRTPSARQCSPEQLMIKLVSQIHLHLVKHGTRRIASTKESPPIPRPHKSIPTSMPAAFSQQKPCPNHNRPPPYDLMY